MGLGKKLRRITAYLLGLTTIAVVAQSSFGPSAFAVAPTDTNVALTGALGIPNRTEGNPVELAIDGDLSTFTYTTPGGTTGTAYFEVSFGSAAVNRLRIWKEPDQGGPQDEVIQYTTDTGSLGSRTWTTVSNLANGYLGTEPYHADAVNTDGTISVDNHNSDGGDGWGSLTFDTVTATGIRVQFARSDHGAGGACCTHYQVNEFEVHLSTDHPPTTSIALSPASPNGSNGWYTSSVHATVTASDTDSTPVSDTRCVLDPSSAPASYDDIPAGCAYGGSGADVSSDGSHTLYTASVDTAGYKGAVASSSFKIDATNPTGGISFPGEGAYDRDSYTAACSTSTGDFCGTAGDDSSGVQKVEYSLEFFQNTYHYWDGTGFNSSTEVFLPSTVTTGWSVDFPVTNFPISQIYGLRIRTTDEAGHTATTDRGFLLDPSPDTRIDSKPTVTNQATAHFTYSSPNAGPNATFDCKLDTGAFASCLPSGQDYTSLAEGSHNFRVKATDSTGHQDPSAASANFTVDLTAPDTQITGHPDDPSNTFASQFFFGVVSDDGNGSPTFKCRLDSTDDADFKPCTNAGQNAAFMSLPEGSHTFEVYATDRAGNADLSPASFTWTIDKTPPNVSVVEGPSGPTNDNTPTFGFQSSTPETTFECSIYPQGSSPTFGTCNGTPTPNEHTPDALADGAYVFAVQATDKAGNTAIDSRSFTVDTTGPTAVITGGPTDSGTSGPNPTFTYSTQSTESDATFECMLDTDADFGACPSDGQSYTGLADGTQYTFSVRAVDTLGNKGPTATRTFTVDASGPTVTITAGPSNGDTTNGTTSFSFSSTENGATFECRLDTDSDFSTCTSPKAYSGVQAGSRTFSVRAVDQYGNRGTADSRAWTVDTQAPDAPVVHGPRKTKNHRPRFSWTMVSGEHYTCTLDGTDLGLCTSPFQPAIKLKFGKHTLIVTAFDAAGNSTPSATKHFKIVR